jgi:LysR family transcriptional regulator, glycine cleavage system transcriptional activator
MTRQNDRLPSLELIRSFESAARHLSFTKAAAELFVTQSAVSRSIRSLETQLGVPLFQRRHRALLLTDAGQTLYRAAADAIERLRDAHRTIRRRDTDRRVTVTTTFSFASMWLVPRLRRFHEQHPDVEIRIAADSRLSDLAREDFDVAIRYCAPSAVPAGTTKLFGEHVFPVCSPSLLRGKHPLRHPQDLNRSVLLHFDDPARQWPWLQWSVWFEVMQLKDIVPRAALRFSEYDHVIQAALDGQGVALGRSPLLKQLINRRRLVAPFEGRAATSRAYFVLTAPAAQARPPVRDFVGWLVRSARRK